MRFHNKQVNYTYTSKDKHKQINTAKSAIAPFHFSMGVDNLEKTRHVKTENLSVRTSFHLSMCVDNLEKTRHFYKDILGVEERRTNKSSVHFNFYGCQLTCHEVPGYSTENIEREVEAETVPVPHFGAAVTFEEFERIKERLIASNIEFIVEAHLRFIGKRHEQYVMFVKDPSGHGIEIKSFTKVPYGDWA